MSENWHIAVSQVEMLTNERPIVGVTPRDSLMEQIISLSLIAIDVVDVRGLERLVAGREAVVVGR